MSIDVAHLEQEPELPNTGLAPRTLWNRQPGEFWDLSLEEAVQTALANNQVMRDLGGRVLLAASTLSSVYDPAIQESDPRFGVEGALSAFDAQFSSQMFWEKNDRVLNNLFLAGGVREFRQDSGNFLAQVEKRTATGGTFTMRNTVDYDQNNLPVNLFPSYWDVAFDAEFRHPLLQGAGVDFNRIAGPGARPGLNLQNGVLLARVDTDVALADFEAGVRDLVSSVENAYWELYFAYRDLDAKVAARDSALETWRRVDRLVQAGGVGGDVSSEAQASAQYFQFQGEAENALSGSPNLINPQPGLAPFLGAGGVYARESDLRLLMGLPANDGRLIRPRDEPTSARIVFDWEQTVGEALSRRVELRRQQWLVKRRELELRASRNFLKPTLDVAGRYRWRGFGDDLIRSNNGPLPQFDNAYQNLTDGDFQEWQLGLMMDLPIGFRQGLAAVRNSQLRLARERATLYEIERQVIHDLAGAQRELSRAYDLSQSTFNLRAKQKARVAAVRREYEAGEVTIDALLAAQKDLAAAEVAYFRSVVAYNVAVKQVHFQKGSLLEYNQVYLSEGPWPMKAYRDAQAKARHRAASRYLNYGYTRPRELTQGPYAQQQDFEEPAPFAPPGTEQPLPKQPGLPPESIPTPGAESLPGDRLPEPPELPQSPGAARSRRIPPVGGELPGAVTPSEFPPRENQPVAPVTTPEGPAAPTVPVVPGGSPGNSAVLTTAYASPSGLLARPSLPAAPRLLPPDTRGAQSLAVPASPMGTTGREVWRLPAIEPPSASH